ncbi:UNVERIFIED_ORG: hypothetical protein GGI63_002390 [Rhizobium esperanzae]
MLDITIPPGVRGCLQARGDVDAVAVDIFAFDNHVAEIDADTKEHAPICRAAGVETGKFVLGVDRRSHRLDHAREIGDQPIAPGVDDTAAMAFDQPPHRLATALQGRKRPLLVGSHQPRIILHVSTEDRRQLAPRFTHGPSSPYRSDPEALAAEAESV